MSTQADNAPAPRVSVDHVDELPAKLKLTGLTPGQAVVVIVGAREVWASKTCAPSVTSCGTR